MRSRQRGAMGLAALLTLPCVFYGQSEGTFAMPNSTLLFETTASSANGATYQELVVVSAGGTVVVQSPTGFSGADYNTAFPALSPDAHQIGWGLSKRDDSRKERLKAVLGVYSLRDGTWKTFGDFCPNGVGSMAFSPDGARIAFASQSALSSQDGYCFDNPIELQVLEISTGKITPIPYAGKLARNARLSWSPSGEYLVGQSCCSPTSASQVVVIDLASGNGRNLVVGKNPSWSPSSEWIAYEDESGKKCILVHPDGTGFKVVQELRGYWMFLKGAVWSPDGTKLLFNEEEIDAGGNVTVLDLNSGRLMKRSKNTLYVLGWEQEPRK